MLHVALRQTAVLPPQQMLACDSGRQIQGHDVLELVAKTIGPTQLIERRARPDPANERLIEHPAIQ